MKTAIVNFSQIDTSCISAKRFCGSCDECNHVWTCELPESKVGRIKLLKERVKRATLKLKSAEYQLREEEKNEL